MPVISEVEQQAYKFQQFHLLDHAFSLRYELFRPDNIPLIDRLPQLAEEMDFKHVLDLQIKGGTWRIFDRRDFSISNFPEGETTIVDSMLAIYEKPERTEGKQAKVMPQNAFLRMSTELIPIDDFAEDLRVFTRYYVDRPRVLGFPSKLTSGFGVLIPSTLAGGGAGAGLDILLNGTNLETAAAQANITGWTGLGLLIGVISSPIAAATAEEYAKFRTNRAINLNQYVGPRNIAKILVEQRDHIIKVGIQKELYKALQDTGIDLTPDHFLRVIYTKIPRDLIQKRSKEILEQTQTDQTVSRMVRAAVLTEQINQLAQQLKLQ